MVFQSSDSSMSLFMHKISKGLGMIFFFFCLLNRKKNLFLCTKTLLRLQRVCVCGRVTDRCFLFVRYSAEEIEEKVSSFRLMLQEKQEPPPSAAEKLT